VGFRQESNSSGLVEPEIHSSDARRIHVRLRRGVCQKTTFIKFRTNGAVPQLRGMKEAFGLSAVDQVSPLSRFMSVQTITAKPWSEP
jgi:hypothetical protein